MCYILLKDIHFKDDNYVEEGSKVIVIHEDFDGMLKVETCENENVKRIFWVEKSLLKKYKK